MTAEGVEVQLLDGSVQTIRFDARGLAPQPAVAAVSAPAPAARTADCSPCAYTDSSGTYHVVESAAEVPPEYRSQTGRIRGSVQRADAVLHRPSTPEEDFEKAREEGAAQNRAALAEYNRKWNSLHPDAYPVLRALNEGREIEPPVKRNELGEDFIQYTNRIGSPY